MRVRRCGGSGLEGVFVSNNFWPIRAAQFLEAHFTSYNSSKIPDDDCFFFWLSHFDGIEEAAEDKCVMNKFTFHVSLRRLPPPSLHALFLTRPFLSQAVRSIDANETPHCEAGAAGATTASSSMAAAVSTTTGFFTVTGASLAVSFAFAARTCAARCLRTACASASACAAALTLAA